MCYLLDTNVISDAARCVQVKQRFSLVPPGLLNVSSVTIKEIQYGRRRNPQASKKLMAEIDALLAQVKVIAFDVQDAYATAAIRAGLERVGTPIGPFDLMIAGTAVARGLIVVTANTREFSRVTGLRHENWRVAPSMVRENITPYRVIQRVLWNQDVV
jgi:tRNA(fMet)-specific endonuclease VapC